MKENYSTKTFGCPDQIADIIDKMRQEDDRTFSNMVVVLLKEAIANRT